MNISLSCRALRPSLLPVLIGMTAADADSVIMGMSYQQRFKVSLTVEGDSEVRRGCGGKTTATGAVERVGCRTLMHANFLLVIGLSTLLLMQAVRPVGALIVSPILRALLACT